MPVRTLLIDNHDSYTYNLFHLLAQAGGRPPEVLANDAAQLGDLDLDAYDNVVISPGPGRPDRPRDFGLSWDLLHKTELPTLGVCLGHQGIALVAGGRVEAAPRARHGHRSPVRHGGDALFAGIPDGFPAVRYHSLRVTEPLPPELEATAWAEDGVVMALRHRRLPRWGVQFHPESVHTEHGLRLLANFHQLSRADAARQRAVSPVPRRRPPARREATEGRRPEPARLHYRLHTRRLDRAVDTEAAFARLFLSSRHSFWLDSAHVEPGLARFSYLGEAHGPLSEVVRYQVDRTRVTVTVPGTPGPPTVHPRPVLDYLREELERRVIDAPPLPGDFHGGYVGYLGYEVKADTVPHATRGRHRAATPDAGWLFADRFLIVDHERGHTHLCALSQDPGTAATAEEWLRETAHALAVLVPVPPLPAGAGPEVEPHLARGRARYLADVRAAQRQLWRGESYEVCLTNHARLPATEDGWTTYRRLRALNPAPYAAYLRWGDLEVACSSPERFLRVGADRTVEAKPIKGTAPRGDTPAQDARIRRELRSDAKTRAENLMIVDLLRNDLGRVCRVGSVHVPVLMAVESYTTVHQLVSTVRGELAPGLRALDAVRACFPGGSMTGAPKARTLEIIDGLEEEARGVYSGVLGFLGCGGTADLNVVIRTLVRQGEHWHLGAGGAVVLDSDPAAEYAEMLLKARAPARALGVGRLPGN
ncbi:aminodeoxychorismate synthase component I [Streptomyces sp. NPDC005438]|uniref:aminodeoxychorismate synthase component I n=1 Tax=Streptomyces sp. NPDC005438 TaxID=3156880 RepID=UPI0033A88B87